MKRPFGGLDNDHHQSPLAPSTDGHTSPRTPRNACLGDCLNPWAACCGVDSDNGSLDGNSSYAGSSSRGSSLLSSSVLNSHQTKRTPQLARQPDEAEALINEELKQLSLVEREKVYEDLHGVSGKVSEEDIALKLWELEKELTKIQPRHPTYLLAQTQSSAYVTNPKLRIMFLRADGFNVPLAAKRFVSWLEWKLDLFGPESLVHDIRFKDDLDAHGKASVKSGQIQLLPDRDASGRAIICFNKRADFDDSHFAVKSVLQAWFYLFMSFIQDDDESQRNGVLIVGLQEGESTPKMSTNNLQCVFKGSQLLNVLPLQIKAMHWCFNDTSMKSIIALAQNAISRSARARFRLHAGSMTECKYALLTFGIPVHVLPIATISYDNGEEASRSKKNQGTNHHLQWMKRIQAKETYMAKIEAAAAYATAGNNCAMVPQQTPRTIPFHGINLPNRSDILLGRGKPTQTHYGNRRLNEMVSTLRNEYDSVKGRGSKFAVAQKVVKWVQNDMSGRFLKRDDDLAGWWVVVSDEVACTKVAHTFRAHRGTDNERQHQQSTASKSSSPKQSTTNENYSLPALAVGGKRIKVS